MPIPVSETVSRPLSKAIVTAPSGVYPLFYDSILLKVFSPMFFQRELHMRGADDGNHAFEGRMRPSRTVTSKVAAISSDDVPSNSV